VPDTARKLLRYLFTGGTAAIVDLEVFRLLCLTRAPIVLAAACSFCAAAVVNFLLSSRWVFDTRATRQAFALFFAGAIVGLLVNVTVTAVCAIHFNLPPSLAKVLGIAAAFLLNFWINMRLVFRKTTTA
jgi:putative flippase GtrA